jgi:DNA-binding protein H-NS
MATYKELLVQQKALNDAIAAAKAHESADAIKAAREMVEAFGLTEEDVFSIKVKKAGTVKGSTVAAKYKDPESGKTWTGRGKAPLWIAGKDKTQFAI